MNISIEKENESIVLKYDASGECVTDKFDFDSIEKLIDFIMKNGIADAVVNPNKECDQYVALLQSILEKIKSEDFIKCYKEALEAKINAEQN